MTPVTIAQLEQAINKARASMPTQGHDARLANEVSLMANIYGELIFRRHKVFDLDSLENPAQQAVRRWLVEVKAA